MPIASQRHQSIRPDVNKLKLYTTIEPDTKNVKPFIIINSFGIFLFSKSDLFMNNNDVTLQQVLQMDPMELFQKSKYKPKK